MIQNNNKKTVNFGKQQIIYSAEEINNLYLSCIEDKTNIQALFNRGKYIYHTKAISITDKNIEYDFDGIEDTSLISLLDFYNEIVVVFFNEEYMFQHILKNLLLDTKADGTTVLITDFPNFVTKLPGREQERVNLPKNYAQLRIVSKTDISETLEIKEVSSGGFSVWVGSSLSLSPNATFNVEIKIDGNAIKCNAQVRRIDFVAGDGLEARNLVGFKILDITEENLSILVNLLKNIKTAT